LNNYFDAKSSSATPVIRRVIIADDHPLVLVGMRKALSMDPCIEIVATAQTVTELMNVLQTTPCDVILCDYSFDSDYGRDGTVLLDKLVRLYPDKKVVVISGHDDMPLIRSIMRRQVHGFVRKSVELERLIEAIRAVCEGRRYADPVTAGKLLDSVFHAARENDKPVALTTREIETLRWLRGGMTIRQIAGQTNRSAKTVSAQKMSAMRKLGARNDLELLAALEHFLNVT
jgi:two-component system capsular synthesis response regulator RcsB